jgi:hypothetical protein
VIVALSKGMWALLCWELAGGQVSLAGR